EAVSISEQAVRLYSELAELNRDAYLPNLASAMNNAGVNQWNIGHLDQAEVEIRIAFDMRRQVFGADHNATLASRSNLATLLRSLGRLEEAEVEMRAVLDASRRVLGEDHPDTLTSRSNLAGLLWEVGRLEEAEVEMRAVLDASRRVLGEDHPDTLTS
ncbi:tetratricopeptide repeat protein, partial [Nonomuraea sp. NPDC004186]